MIRAWKDQKWQYFFDNRQMKQNLSERIYEFMMQQERKSGIAKEDITGNEVTAMHVFLMTQVTNGLKRYMQGIGKVQFYQQITQSQKRKDRRPDQEPESEIFKINVQFNYQLYPLSNRHSKIRFSEQNSEKYHSSKKKTEKKAEISAKKYSESKEVSKDRAMKLELKQVVPIESEKNENPDLIFSHCVPFQLEQKQYQEENQFEIAESQKNNQQNGIQLQREYAEYLKLRISILFSSVLASTLVTLSCIDFFFKNLSDWLSFSIFSEKNKTKAEENQINIRKLSKTVDKIEISNQKSHKKIPKKPKEKPSKSQLKQVKKRDRQREINEKIKRQMGREKSERKQNEEKAKGGKRNPSLGK